MAISLTPLIRIKGKNGEELTRHIYVGADTILPKMEVKIPKVEAKAPSFFNPTTPIEIPQGTGQKIDYIVF